MKLLPLTSAVAARRSSSAVGGLAGQVALRAALRPARRRSRARRARARAGSRRSARRWWRARARPATMPIRVWPSAARWARPAAPSARSFSRADLVERDVEEAVEQHDRHASPRAHACAARRRHAAARRPAAPPARARSALVLGVVARVAEQQRVAGRGLAARSTAAISSHQVRVPEPADGQPERLGAGAGERAGDRVGRVARCARSPPARAARGGAGRPRAVDDVRDRRHGDARQSRDIGHRDHRVDV